MIDPDAILTRVLRELDAYLTSRRIIIPTERLAALARHTAATVELYSRVLAESARETTTHHELVRFVGHAAADAAADEVRAEMILRQHGSGPRN